MVLIFAEQQTDAGFTKPSAAYNTAPQMMYGYAAQPQHHHQQHYHAAPNDQKAKYLLAERYKTKMCRNYMTTGACPYTHRCMFAHGQQELRTTDMNVRDGLMTEEAIRSFQRAMTAYNHGELAVPSHYPQQEVAPASHHHQQQQQSEQCPCDDCAAAAAARAATQHNPYYSAMPQAFASAGYGQQQQE